MNLGRDTARDIFETTSAGWSLTQPEGEVGLEVTVEPVGDVTTEPIETSSTSLEGLQTMFQGTIVTTTWALRLAAGDKHEIRQALVPRLQPNNLDKPARGVSA